ncbi:unnamed protein product [Rotaria sp. Silwood1]|nr:unnamed protein product [Rotaria sp. Silwood1]CAF1189751.1 unnamed protein product [Rotaria sp. Silwood1]CAF3470539.1 unnamed protein product [Rotaria sp. Silwood1]CAF3483582.1 unnamed protein product [Rotaria sp. Silwood1]CAF4551448.1 unnamed protein product [Rotaria sp. Silwood1]
MGTWIGHIAPGIVFILLAFWWHINNCARYIRSLVHGRDEKTKQEKYKFQGSTTYPCICLPGKVLRRLPIESIVKIIVTSIHFTIELTGGYSSQPRPHIMDVNVQHMAMLFGFFVGSWVEILVHYKVPLPHRINQVMGILAFAIEGLMLVVHLHARVLVEGHIHRLLFLTVICSMIGAIGESFDPNNFWFIVARSFFALTQGTWFLQAAYVIWPQTTNPYFVWDLESHRSISLLSMSYAYHLAGNAFLLIVVYLLVYKFILCKMKLNHNQVDDDEAIDGYKLIVNGNDEENVL